MNDDDSDDDTETEETRRQPSSGRSNESKSPGFIPLILFFWTKSVFQPTDILHPVLGIF